MKSPEKEWAEGRREVRRMPCHRNRRHFKIKGVNNVKWYSAFRG